MGVFRAIMDGLAQSASMVRYVYTIEYTPDIVAPNLDIIGYLDTMWTTTMLGTLNPSWTNQRVIVEVPTGTKWSYQTEFPYVKAGTAGVISDALPNQVAAVVVGITPSRRRGKKFIYGLLESNQGGGLWGTAELAQLASFAGNYVSTYTGGAGDLVPGVCKKDGTDFLAFNGYRVDPIAGTQRRRKQGVGK